MIVCFVDIVRPVDHHWLNFLYKQFDWFPLIPIILLPINNIRLFIGH